MPSDSAWGVSTDKASITDGQTSIFGYTGQYKGPVLSGRVYLRERSYDPGSRRFTTPDPEPAANDSPNLSPYAYANNDPINQSDPSGRCPLCVSAGIGSVIGAAVEGGIYGWQHRDGGFTWGGFAKAAGEGAVTGAHPAPRCTGRSTTRGTSAPRRQLCGAVSRRCPSSSLTSPAVDVLPYAGIAPAPPANGTAAHC
ncbi:RHS repeat-associated core domain-containing protein [Streptomyces bullii]|uniref:RHS repeat-associated core domain-containing protein n=1 Tax=Streptomyces bullii TaxID=349910 RepID=A0ABW0V1I2_9ACTN